MKRERERERERKRVRERESETWSERDGDSGGKMVQTNDGQRGMKSAQILALCYMLVVQQLMPRRVWECF